MLPSSFSTLAIASLIAAVAADAGTCPIDSPLSCSTSSPANTCCTELGGLVVQVQFWDAGSKSKGPSNSWTIHGLWPDNCNGTYEANCDASREYTDISNTLTEGGASSTLSYMQEYWKDINNDDESFWAHEWGKHGTCYSTLQTSCYSPYTDREEVVDYFEATVTRFKALPTYDWLAAAGITPSATTRYTKVQVNAALRAEHGYDVVLNCQSGKLNEIYYAFHLRGSIATGEYVPTAPVGSSGSCASSFLYQPKQDAASKRRGSSKQRVGGVDG